VELSLCWVVLTSTIKLSNKNLHRLNPSSDFSPYTTFDYSSQTQLAIAIKEREKAELFKAREQILAIAHSAGISLQELLSASKDQPKKTVAIRYQHPSDTSLHWTGRGRQPKWVQDWIAAGHLISTLDVAMAG